jgi:cytidylate kinase
MEGRDIQTVVFPDAEIKVFLTASDEERARRRWKELLARGQAVDFVDVLAEVRDRDTRDVGREASPLRAAANAICIDTDGRTISEVVDSLLHIIETWRKHPDLRGERLASAAGFTREMC